MVGGATGMIGVNVQKNVAEEHKAVKEHVQNQSQLLEEQIAKENQQKHKTVIHNNVKVYGKQINFAE